jgi:hypothetical protein
MIWRNGAASRLVWIVAGVYAAVIVAFWVLFAFADVDEERLRDLDTYYANTPYMREIIVLYLLAHLAACLVTSHLIWHWKTSVFGLLRTGLLFLGIGYGLNLVYDAVKITAVVARWCDSDLDWLSTHVAPPVACLSALLIAIGFLVPHAGEHVRELLSHRAAHRRLAPLHHLLATVVPPTAEVRLRFTAPIDLRLLQRSTFIGDALLHLGPYIDDRLRERSAAAARAAGHRDREAEHIGAAVAVLDAVDHRRRDLAAGVDHNGDFQRLHESMRAIENISAVLSHPTTQDLHQALKAVETEHAPS